MLYAVIILAGRVGLLAKHWGVLDQSQQRQYKYGSLQKSYIKFKQTMSLLKSF